MLAMPRLSGSAAAFIAALASYRPMPNPPRRPDREARADRGTAERRGQRPLAADPSGRKRRR